MTPAARALHTMDRLFRTTLGAPSTVGRVLDRRADLVWRAHQDGEPAVAVLLRAHGFDGTPTHDDVRAAIAREHGFADWDAVAAHRDQQVDPRFEAAADAIVSGDPDALHAILARNPALARNRSPFGHHAMLIHYVTANGVESSRQWQSPRNAADVLRVLLRHGADPDAVCDAYGGGITPLCLLVSSRHPADAGVQADLVEELCHGGANPDGRAGDPLWTAITYGYPAAVDALVRCGARLDNLVFAAAAGDLAKVRDLLDDDRPHRVGVRGPLLDPAHMIEYALIYSAGLGRHAVVTFLLGRHPDLGVIEPVFHSTAAGMARYHHRSEILAILEN